MRQGERITRTELAKAFTAYLETGSLAAAAREISAHPQTIRKQAKKLEWKQRRSRILSESSAATDQELIHGLTAENAISARTWKALTKEQFSRAGVLKLLELMRGK